MDIKLSINDAKNTANKKIKNLIKYFLNSLYMLIHTPFGEKSLASDNEKFVASLENIINEKT